MNKETKTKGETALKPVYQASFFDRTKEGLTANFTDVRHGRKVEVGVFVGESVIIITQGNHKIEVYPHQAEAMAKMLLRSLPRARARFGG